MFKTILLYLLFIEIYFIACKTKDLIILLSDNVFKIFLLGYDIFRRYYDAFRVERKVQRVF